MMTKLGYKRLMREIERIRRNRKILDMSRYTFAKCAINNTNCKTACCIAGHGHIASGGDPNARPDFMGLIRCVDKNGREILDHTQPEIEQYRISNVWHSARAWYELDYVQASYLFDPARKFVDIVNFARSNNPHSKKNKR